MIPDVERQMRLPWLTLAILAATLLVLLSCQTSESGETQPIGLAERNLSIYEAVFRHQFGRNASAMQSSAQAYFLSIEGGDPPSGFLNRFKGNQPPVRPGSEFQKGLGLLFRVDEIREIDPTTIEADGGYYEAELSSSGNTYRLQLREGSWIVVSDIMHWIS